MNKQNKNWLHDLFINEAKAAQNYHNRGGEETPTQEKAVDITANGTVIVEPDEGHTMSKVTAKVNVPKDGVDKIQLLIEGKKNSAKNLFYDFKGDNLDALMDGVDTSSITSTNGMFFQCGNIKSAPMLNTSNVTDMSNMFYYCTVLASVPLYDTKNVTNMYSMFNRCKALTSVPLFDTSNVNNFESMFIDCTALTLVPLFDTKNATTMYSMFKSCTALTSVPLFDTSKVASMNTMFSGCTSLASVPLFDTKNVTNMSYMFQNCTALTSVPEFDMRKVTSSFYATSMFSNCSALTECRVRNINTDLQIGSGTSYGHLLTIESLLHLCKECLIGSKKLTVGSANLEKLANVYVKRIAITDEMRAEDDLIDKKYPFVQCDSTDDGAMTIQDYMATKYCSLA